jgi:hypothetical protein
MAAPLDPALAAGEDGPISELVQARIAPLYRSGEQGTDTFDYAIWSDWGSCDACGEQFRLYDTIIDWDAEKILDVYPCPSCGSSISSRKQEKAFETIRDDWTQVTKRRARTTLVAISKRQGNRAIRREANAFDLQLAQQPMLQTPNRLPAELE